MVYSGFMGNLFDGIVESLCLVAGVVGYAIYAVATSTDSMLAGNPDIVE
jgi:hypothetical protein